MFKEISPIKVITPKIPDKSITNAKLADNAVNGRVLAEGSVDIEHLAFGLYRHRVTFHEMISGRSVDITFDYITAQEDPFEEVLDFPALNELVLFGSVRQNQFPHDIEITREPYSAEVRVNYLVYSNAGWTWDYITFSADAEITDTVKRII